MPIPIVMLDKAGSCPTEMGSQLATNVRILRHDCACSDLNTMARNSGRERQS